MKLNSYKKIIALVKKIKNPRFYVLIDYTKFFYSNS